MVGKDQGEGQVKPAGVSPGMGLETGPDLIWGLEAIIVYLVPVGMDGLVINAYKNMIELEFGQAILQFRSISEMEAFLQSGSKSQFFLQSPDSRVPGVFPGAGVTAAGIGPQPGAMIFIRGPLL